MNSNKLCFKDQNGEVFLDLQKNENSEVFFYNGTKRVFVEVKKISEYHYIFEYFEELPFTNGCRVKNDCNYLELNKAELCFVYKVDHVVEVYRKAFLTRKHYDELLSFFNE